MPLCRLFFVQEDVDFMDEAILFLVVSYLFLHDLMKY